jgi:CRP-like cAMP-binding protein
MMTLEQFLKGFGVRTELAALITAKAKTVELAEGEHFLKRQVVADRIGYLESGLLLSSYLNKKGDEITSKFYYPESHVVVADYESFVNQKRSLESIRALEPSRLMVLDKNEFSFVLEGSQELMEAVRLIADERFLLALKRIRQLQITPSHERVRLFVEHHGTLVGRASDQQMSSYLGLTIKEYQHCLEELQRAAPMA